jgi:glycosyltransferase involved in cell wall biosynthesis
LAEQAIEEASKMKNSGKLISACMMVKNEAHNLERCLASIKPLVDEIVVVDTGSTDETVSIAKKYNARVYHHPWQNDFSLHRNQSISYARNKWVFIIDADEELCLANGSKWSDAKTVLQKIDGKYPASAILLKDLQKGLEVMQFNTTRFFKKNKVRYEGIVHNQPQVEGQAVYNPHIYIKHYGYDLTPEKKQAKYERSRGLLLKQVENNELTDGLPYFFLCQLCAEYKNLEESVEWGEKYWQMFADGKILDKHFNHVLYFTMTRQYMKIGNRKKAYEWLERGVKSQEGDLDLAMAALEYGIWVQQEDLIYNAAKDFIQLYNKYLQAPEAKAKKFVFTLRPEVLAIAQYQLTLVCLKQGSMALQALGANLQKLPAPYREGMLRDLAKALEKTGLPIKFGRIEKSADAGEEENRKAELTTMSL